MENAQDELRYMRSLITSYEWDGQFLKAELIRRYYVELANRFSKSTGEA